MTLLTAWQAFCDVTGISLVVGDPLLALLLCICAAYLAGPSLHKVLLDALPPEEPPTRSSSRHGSSSSSSRSRSERSERSERREKGASASSSTPGQPSKHRPASKHSSSSSSRAAQAALETAARDALRARAGQAASVFREGSEGVLGPPSQVTAARPSAPETELPPPSVPLPSSPAAGRPPRPESRGGFRADSPDSFAFAPHRPPRSDTPDPLVRQIPGRRTVAFAAEEEHIPPPAAPVAAAQPPSPPRHGAGQHLDSPPSRGSSARGSPRSPLGLSSPPASPPQMQLEPVSFPVLPPVLSWEDELRAELAAEEAAAAAEAAEREAAAVIEATLAAAEEEARREKSDMIARLMAQAEALAAQQRAAAAAERFAALAEERQQVAAAMVAAAEAEAAAHAALAAGHARSSEREAMEHIMGFRHGGEDADSSFAFSVSFDDGASVATDEAELAMVSEAHQRAEALRAAEAIIEAEAATLSARLTRDAIAAVVARNQAPAPKPVQRVEPPSPPSAHARPPLGHHKPSALARRRRRDDGDGEAIGDAQPSPVVVTPEQTATPTPVRSSLGSTLSLPVTPPSEGSVTSATQSRAASLTELALMAEAADATGGSWYGSTQASPAGTPPPSPRHPLSRSASRASSVNGGAASAMPEPPQEHRIGRRSNSPLPGGGIGEQQLLAPEEADALGQLKIVMDLAAQPPGSPVKAFCTDACLARYLRASRWDVAAAAKMVHATMEWRRSSRVEEVTWDEVGAPLSRLPVFCLDVRDRYGRPVLVLRPGAVTSLADEEVVRLLEYTMEAVCNAIDKQLPQSAHPPRGSRADLSAEQLLLLVDGTDWSVMVPGGRTALRRCIKILSRHYPERLGAALVLHPPRLFGTMWAVVSSFLDARTAAKVNVVSTDKFKQRELLAVYFDNLGQLDAALGGDHSGGFDERVYVQRMRDVDATRARTPGSPSGSTSGGAEASSPRSPARHDDEEPEDETEAQEAADSEVADITASARKEHRSKPSSRVDQRAAGAAIAAAAMERAKRRAAARDEQSLT